MSTSITQHHVIGIEVETKAHAIRIKVSVLYPEHTGAFTNWTPGKLDVDLYANDNRLELLKQLSEAATYAYQTELMDAKS